MNQIEQCFEMEAMEERVIYLYERIDRCFAMLDELAEDPRDQAPDWIDNLNTNIYRHYREIQMWVS
jgi:hypothetical protein